jgi:hypothetical protein
LLHNPTSLVVKEKQPSKDVTMLSEQEQLELAIRESIGKSKESIIPPSSPIPELDTSLVSSII